MGWNFRKIAEFRKCIEIVPARRVCKENDSRAAVECPLAPWVDEWVFRVRLGERVPRAV